MYQKIKKIIILIAVISLVIFFAFILIRGCGDDRTYSYTYEKIGKGSVEKTISASGHVEVQNLERVLSKMSGIVSHVYVNVHDNVKKGKLLAVFDSTDIDQNLKKSKVRFDNVSDELEKAKRELENSKNMLKENLISKQSFENSTYQYKSVLNKYKQIKIDHEIMLEQKRHTKVYSPISGIIIDRNVNNDFPIGNNREMFTIAPSLKKMIVLIDVDESDIGYVKKNQDVIFTVSAYPDSKFKGTIQYVSISPKNKGGIISYGSTVVCKNEDLKLKPGMTASATVIVKRKKNVLRALNQAFLVSPIEIPYDQDDENKYVWKKTKSIVDAIPMKRVNVKTGLVGDMYTEITENLKEGDEVLIKVIEEKG